VNTNATRSQCIDAETLAAWADGGLPAHDAAQVELHLSNCDRCQAVLAAFVRSEPAAAVVLPFWSRRPVRWSAGVLAAAAAVTLVVWSGRPAVEPKQEATMALNEAGAEASAEFRAPAPLASRPAADKRIDDLKKAATEEAKAPDSASQLANQAKEKPISQAAAEAERQAVLPSATAPAALPPVPATPPPPAAQALPARAAPPPPSEPPVTVRPANPAVVGGVTAGRVVSAEPAAELRDQADRDAWRLAVVEIVEPNTATFAARRLDAAQAAGRSAGGGRGGAAGTAVPVKWRILGGTRVERSVDNGTNWNAVKLAPASANPFILTGGAAASQSVCWLVGRDGVVFLAKDGVTFEQVTSPDPATITSIQAEDANHATITTTDGRVFTTADGGLTWAIK